MQGISVATPQDKQCPASDNAREEKARRKIIVGTILAVALSDSATSCRVSPA